MPPPIKAAETRFVEAKFCAESPGELGKLVLCTDVKAAIFPLYFIRSCYFDIYYMYNKEFKAIINNNLFYIY
jgi:hypothetical protein